MLHRRVTHQITGKLSSVPSLSGELNASCGLSGEISMAQSAPAYEGQYIVTPSVTDDILLDTAGKYVKQNINVTKIPYYETTNASGGYTAIIG